MISKLAEAINKKELCADISCELEETLLKKLSSLSADLYNKMEQLSDMVEPEKEFDCIIEEAKFYRSVLSEQMESTRTIADGIESLVGAKYWPYPTYGDLLFSVI